jgi:hypothetical protein
MGSLPWMLSGFGHFLSGFGAILLGMATFELFWVRRPLAGRLGLAFGAIAGAAFLLTGISDMMGGQAMALLAAQNEASVEAIYLAGSLGRIAFNGLAIVSFGCFAFVLSWCGLKTGLLPRPFAWFGFLAGTSGLVLAFAYIPIYLSVYLIYALWLGVTLLRVQLSTSADQA